MKSQRWLPAGVQTRSAAWGSTPNELYYDGVTDTSWSIIRLDLESSDKTEIVNVSNILDTNGASYPTNLDVSPNGLIIFQIQGIIFLFDPETETLTNLTNTNVAVNNNSGHKSHPHWYCQPTE
jgi:hypothetical protein